MSNGTETVKPNGTVTPVILERNNKKLNTEEASIKRGKFSGSIYLKPKIEGLTEQDRTSFIKNTVIPWLGDDTLTDIIERYLSLQAQDAYDSATDEATGKVSTVRFKEIMENLSARGGETIEQLEERLNQLISVELDKAVDALSSPNPSIASEAGKHLVKIKTEIKNIKESIALRRRPRNEKSETEATPSVAVKS
jgi:hypothetical protein